MHSALILIPTYNEATNAPALAEAILDMDLPADVVFIDDASPDGTGMLLDQLAQEYPSIQVLHRESKQGLGSAYLTGFEWSLEHSYSFSICMDADFSHDPADLPRFLQHLENEDLVAGSRYLPSGGILNWPWNRRFLSRAAAVYTRMLTRMPFTDPTGGFTGYRNDMLARLPLDKIASQGYSFQIEMKVLAWKQGFRTLEIPILFTERRTGKSKMSAGIIREALWVVWKLVLKRNST
ncbi:MAG: polyprenol monophosphomannose synthase [Kiritimatiellae bacterium]|jgi:dolichol-phosphate mannosyltransferase|nr:polyprenol monophosphomannose synthase [Kiritimatiellia bacterium]